MTHERLGPSKEIVVYSTVWCPDCKRAKRFLAEQRIPYVNIDIEQDAEAMALVEAINQGKRVIPTIVFPDGDILVEPTNAQLAEKLGLQTKAQRSFYDAIVIGAGPTGLTAALYLAREGLDTLVVEKGGVGGQVGVTQRLDNFPGFGEGVGGAELGVRLAHQARRFGVVEDRATGEVKEWHYDGIFVFIGLSPNSDLAREKAELDPMGFVVTDARLMTSLPGLFAAGDVRAGSTK